MPTSSSRLEARLAPDPWSRRLVFGCGVCLFLTGLGICWTLPLAHSLRICLATIWVFDAGRDLHRQSRGRHRLHLLVLEQSGQCLSQKADGSIESLTLLNGSIVMRSWAWLRVGFADQLIYGELLLRRRVPAREWHRLQLLWHQSAATPGASGAG